MRSHTVTVREGTDVGPVDWEHPTAKDKPQIWREAEKNVDGFLLNGRAIITMCMYDGWPYWKPTPAIYFVGPLNSGEWAHFNSYGVHGNSITRKKGELSDAIARVLGTKKKEDGE